MVRSSIKALTVLLAAAVFASCATIAEEAVNILLDNNSTMNLSSKPQSGRNDKQLSKEIEKLKKEGKCPICRGMGRTPDGQYICETCKGTGKYVEINNKQE